MRYAIRMGRSQPQKYTEQTRVLFLCPTVDDTTISSVFFFFFFFLFPVIIISLWAAGMSPIHTALCVYALFHPLATVPPDIRFCVAYPTAAYFGCTNRSRKPIHTVVARVTGDGRTFIRLFYERRTTPSATHR